MNWLERWAEKFLRKRGRVVLSRHFTGIAMGNACGIYRDNGHYTEYRITVPRGARPIVINNSTLMEQREREP